MHTPSYSCKYARIIVMETEHMLWPLSGHMCMPVYFSTIFARGYNFHDSIFALLGNATFQKGSCLKEINLLL